MANVDRWLVLGAGSWLGYLLLAQEAADTAANTTLLGTVHKLWPVGLPAKVKLQQAESREEYVRIVDEFKPTMVVNFLRGEDAAGLALHDSMAASCRQSGAMYVYASSISALDGYGGSQPLTEDMPVKSTTAYGRFKGECENTLQKEGGDGLILRFASVQGWVPHKSTRNEKFLRKVSKGENVQVDTGIVQNRMMADLLIEAIRTMTRDRVTGVVHLGATDASEEIDFLRTEAAAFGWDRLLMKAGPAKPTNLFCQPGRIIQLYGKRFQPREQDTLNALVRHPGLQCWHKSN